LLESAGETGLKGDENVGFYLNELGQQFVHNAMSESPLKIEFKLDDVKP